MAEYRAVDGDPELRRYALQAVPPIDNIVKNCNVTLDGVMATEMDRNLSEIRANSVPGMFSVTDHLRVET